MRRTTAAAILFSLAAAGCGDDGTDPVTPQRSDDASLHVINAAAGAVDVTVDGAVVRRDLAPGAVSDRIGITAGSRTVELRLSATQAAAPGVTFEAREGRSYFVSGTATTGGGVAAQVDTGASPVPGRSKLRILHTAADAPPLDVWRTQPDFATPTRIQFPFPYGSKSPFIESDPGTWEVWVTPEGATEPRLATSGPVALEGGWVRTLILIDAPDGSGLQIVDDR